MFVYSGQSRHHQPALCNLPYLYSALSFTIAVSNQAASPLQRHMMHPQQSSGVTFAQLLPFQVSAHKFSLLQPHPFIPPPQLSQTAVGLSLPELQAKDFPQEENQGSHRHPLCISLLSRTTVPCFPLANTLKQQPHLFCPNLQLFMMEGEANPAAVTPFWTEGEVTLLDSYKLSFCFYKTLNFLYCCKGN